MNGIGIVFNIDDLGGGFYGSRAWRVFMRVLSPESLGGCMVKEGDTNETLAGSQREYCIALFGIALDEDSVREAFESSSEVGLAPAERRILSNPESEPLVLTGFIDSFGRFVEDEWSRSFHDRCKETGWGYAPKTVTVDLSPELQGELDAMRQLR